LQSLVRFVGVHGTPLVGAAATLPRDLFTADSAEWKWFRSHALLLDSFSGKKLSEFFTTLTTQPDRPLQPRFLCEFAQMAGKARHFNHHATMRAVGLRILSPVFRVLRHLAGFRRARCNHHTTTHDAPRQVAAHPRDCGNLSLALIGGVEVADNGSLLFN